MIALVVLILAVALAVAVLTRRVDPIAALVVLAILLVIAYVLMGTHIVVHD
jgi:uncharacterized membrane protein